VKPTVLFICTGNYYRSRFAEALFNHFANAQGMKWRAISRGLAISPANESALSPIAQIGLDKRNISSKNTSGEPRELKARDLVKAKLIIAVDEIEHKPMISREHPGWIGDIIYWNVRDVSYCLPDQALSSIEKHVLQLLGTLRISGAGSFQQ
jgi:protein-tyrosine phosphatase